MDVARKRKGEGRRHGGGRKKAEEEGVRERREKGGKVQKLESWVLMAGTHWHQ